MKQIVGFQPCLKCYELLVYVCMHYVIVNHYSQLVAVNCVFNLLLIVAILMCSVNISLPVCSLTY